MSSLLSFVTFVTMSLKSPEYDGRIIAKNVGKGILKDEIKVSGHKEKTSSAPVSLRKAIKTLAKMEGYEDDRLQWEASL